MTRTRGNGLRTASAAVVAAAFMLAAPQATAAFADPTPASTTCVSREICDAVASLANLRLEITQLVTAHGLVTSLTTQVDAATTSVLSDHIPAALSQLQDAKDELSDTTKLAAALVDVLRTAFDSNMAIIANIK